MTQALAPALHRVVVTGVGAITSVGHTFEETWNNVISGYSGVRKNEFPDFPSLPCRIAAKVPRIDNESVLANNDPTHNNNPPSLRPFDPKEHLTRGESYYTDPNIQFAITAAAEAMQNSGLAAYLETIDKQSSDRYRIGVSFASAVGGYQSFEGCHDKILTDQYKKISPYVISNIVINTASSAISLRYGLRGPNLASATACSASAHAIQKGVQLIQSGQCDVVIVGGTEAAITPTFVAGLSRCKALATKYNERPSLASRPWDRARNGFVMGEGAACLVLESESFARNRGVSSVMGEIVGGASTADAYHCTGLDPSGEHVRQCMRMAMDSARRNSGDAQMARRMRHLNAHATSTEIGDKTELKAIMELFASEGIEGEDVRRVRISGTKSSMGHLMGASGAIEAALTLQALKMRVAPPTLNLEHCDEFVPAEVNLVANEAQALDEECEYAMSNSFGFGGTNASIVFRRRDRL